MVTNWIQIHLALNHIPIVGVMFALPMLVYGMISKVSAIKRLALIFCVVSGLSSVPALYSGKWAEHQADKLAGMTEEKIDLHEHAAEEVMWLSLLWATLALVSIVLISKQPGRANPVLLIHLLFGFFILGKMGNVAHLGGLLRHPEIDTLPVGAAEAGKGAGVGAGKEVEGIIHAQDKDDDEKKIPQHP